MKKRHSIQIISILSVLILFLNCFVVQAATPATQFSDVKKTDWYYAAVNYAVENKLMNGVGSGKFAPNDAASRAMLVTLLYRMEGEPKVSAKTPFTDLKDDWYKAPVAWAYTNKIVNGTSNTTFGPTNPLTREQFATIMYRYCKEFLKLDVSTNAQLSGYPDQKSISGYAKDAMIWANAEGLITGSNEGGKIYLRPQQTATRAQMATIFQRFDTYLEKKEEQEQETPVAPPAEKPCDYSGKPSHKNGTRGTQSKHFYFCRDEGCVNIKEVPCSLRVETIPATCKEHSISTYSCTLCGYEETIVNSSEPLADHSWNETPTHMKNQTPSSHYYTCKYKCSKIKQETCNFTVTKIPAEIGKNGIINYHCALCGYTYSTPDPDAPALKDPNGTTIKLMSQNLKKYEADAVTDFSAEVRQYRFKALVEKYDPDVIATQEFDSFWQGALPTLLGEDYTMYFKYRESPKGSDEACAILWKKDKFELLDKGYFWLSDNPNSSTPVFGQYYPRICNWVRLMDKESGVTIRVASTHLGFYKDENENPDPKPIEIFRKLFEQECEKAGDEPYILMGDFNFSYQSEQYNVLMNTNALYDLRPAAEAAAKKGQCELGDIRNGTSGALNSSYGSNFIDYIFAGKNAPINIQKFGYCYDRFAVPERGIGEGPVSDHFAVYSEVRVGVQNSN